MAATEGPIYGVQLIDTLPLGNGSMLQAMPNRDDLQRAKRISERVVGGYEVLLWHYRDLQAKLVEQEKTHREEVDRLKGLIRDAIAYNWPVTDLQKEIGDV